MLERLHIENIAVIESADIDLSSGFTVLTGETGAGKSVLIHSLNLILGERVNRDIVRSGCEKATVSGLFTGLSEESTAMLREQGFVCDGEVLIQRDLTSEGKSSVRINGRPATVSMLRDFAGRLVNIHGQHDNRALLDPATHVRYLDSFARNEEARTCYERIFSELKQVLRRISEISTDDQARMQKIDLLSYQVNEIDSAHLKCGEEESLEQRRTVLCNGEKIESSLSAAYRLCSEENNARDKLGQACFELESISSFSPRLGELSDRLISLSDQLDDLASDLRECMEEHSFDPAELNEAEERLDLIYRLKRKYGSTVQEILDYRDNAAAELDSINVSEERLNELNLEKGRLYRLLKDAAEALTATRKKAGETLEKNLTEQLAFLDMPNTGFSVTVDPAGTFTPKGADTVEFLLSANLGEDLRPLSKIASGGELSRIMLSMKTCLSLDEDAETLIFDEIDTGVSGKAAEKIAMKLKEISNGKQVVVVTHLAQIAAYADHHYLIAKSTSDNRTYTTVSPLDRAGRIGELARIIGGISPTQATIAAAEDLLQRGSE
ncbi:MAG: DNA repair protein RecN [Clostridia bacterium]|nr:DNA repair protein RecN [Clostridia bacterium]